MSSGRFMWIEFDSDSSSTEKGFSATYTAFGKLDRVDPFACVIIRILLVIG